MSKLDELRKLGYGLTLLPGDEIDIDFPESQEPTRKLEDRLIQLKPLLIQDFTSAYGVDFIQIIVYIIQYALLSRKFQIVH